MRTLLCILYKDNLEEIIDGMVIYIVLFNFLTQKKDKISQHVQLANQANPGLTRFIPTLTIQKYCRKKTERNAKENQRDHM